MMAGRPSSHRGEDGRAAHDIDTVLRAHRSLAAPNKVHYNTRC